MLLNTWGNKAFIISQRLVSTTYFSLIVAGRHGGMMRAPLEYSESSSSALTDNAFTPHDFASYSTEEMVEIEKKLASVQENFEQVNN